jgi:hypothetical protein
MDGGGAVVSQDSAGGRGWGCQVGPGGQRERKRRERAPSRLRPAGPWAGSAVGPDSVPRPFTLFFCSFHFLISYLCYNLFKTDSNPIKSNSKFF